MKAGTLHNILKYALAGVWLANGLLCKVLHLVPRHEAIVARILGPTYAAPITQSIGLAEIGMAVWVLSGRYVRLSTAAQLGLVASMNVLEFFLAPDLLLWKQLNIVFAAALMGVVYYYGRGLTPPWLSSLRNVAAWLKNHPFAVEALLARTTVLTFAAPVASLQALLPACLTLDTFGGSWGFVAVAMVQTTGLRPMGLPAWLGHDFFLVGYRVFVRFTTQGGKNLRGLYILKSETDKPRMELLGNLFTSYCYATIDIQQQVTASGLRIISGKGKLDVEVNTVTAEPALPAGSPFATWQQARRFAGPLPFTFSYDPQAQQVTIVEGHREDWIPRPVLVEKAQVGFVEALELKGLQLASAFTMEDIPYQWQKGRTESWRR